MRGVGGGPKTAVPLAKSLSELPSVKGEEHNILNSDTRHEAPTVVNR